MIFGANPSRELSELHFNTPADVFPILAGTAKLEGLGALVAIGLCDTDRENACVDER